MFHVNFTCTFSIALNQSATGPSSVCEGSDVTLQCVIIFTSASNVVTKQAIVWNRNNGESVTNKTNHNQLHDPDTGKASDLVITNVRLEDDNTVYTCTAPGSNITSSVVLNVTGKFYLCIYVRT